MYYYSNKNEDKKTKKKLLKASFITIVPFIVILIITFSDWDKITEFDYQISNFFYSWHTPVLNKIMIAITHLGDMVTQTLVTSLTVVVLLIAKKWRTALWYGFSVLGGALFLNGIIKEFYARARPSQIKPLVEIGGYSFPSGHSMGSIIVYGGILFIVLQSIRSTYLKVFITSFLSIMIFSIGLSRIYLAVHYPSDVIGGFSLGLTWILVSISFFGLKYINLEIRNRNRFKIKSL